MKYEYTTIVTFTHESKAQKMLNSKREASTTTPFETQTQITEVPSEDDGESKRDGDS